MSRQKRRVLCAEPHEDTCRLLTELLAGQGHEVATAKTVAECLGLVRGGPRFDLYMLDDHYIDGSAIELCRELRRATPDTPILFFSSLALQRDRDRARAAGADAYLTKPNDIFEIVQTVNSIFAHGRARRARPDAD